MNFFKFTILPCLLLIGFQAAAMEDVSGTKARELISLFERVSAIEPDESPCGFGHCHLAGTLSAICASSECEVWATTSGKAAEHTTLRGIEASLVARFLTTSTPSGDVSHAKGTITILCSYPNGTEVDDELFSCSAEAGPLHP